MPWAQALPSSAGFCGIPSPVVVYLFSCLLSGEELVDNGMSLPTPHLRGTVLPSKVIVKNSDSDVNSEVRRRGQH